MNGKARWTIAIPTFDGAAHIGETLRSVLAQTDPDFELLVCDDGSRDDTLAIVRSICGAQAGISCHTSGKALGLAGNWNRCVAESTGEWITILHQDDLLAPEFLAEHRRIAAIDPTIGLIVGPVTMIDEAGRAMPRDDSEFVWPDRFTVWTAQSLSRVLVAANPIRCPGVSFRRDLHERLGGFDGRWKYVLDWDFWYRAGQVSAVAFAVEPLAKQRWHTASETHRLARGTVDLEENSRLMRSILAAEPFQDGERPRIEAKIRKRMARAWLTRACQAARMGDRKLQHHALRHAWMENRHVVLHQLACDPRSLARLIWGPWRTGTRR